MTIRVIGYFKRDGVINQVYVLCRSLIMVAGGEKMKLRNQEVSQSQGFAKHVLYFIL
jgi:hypothetical protein